MWKSKQLDELVNQLIDSIPPGIRELPGEMEKNFKAILQGGASRLDLVTREEFDTQVEMLHQTRRKLETLEQELQLLLDRHKEPTE